ncbi:hypothetical protein EYF80_036604 [Liparis tanakae]|uniref:Uncharacterized protein n=1 Tax=Liparis tanakae TaxID=230148 RepID=A0A4Z2GIV9_9TELE|nr:hypothetical protein EYF80_036604 [Liparis tanakae]
MEERDTEQSCEGKLYPDQSSRKKVERLKPEKLDNAGDPRKKSYMNTVCGTSNAFTGKENPADLNFSGATLSCIRLTDIYGCSITDPETGQIASSDGDGDPGCVKCSGTKHPPSPPPTHPLVRQTLPSSRSDKEHAEC